MRIRHQLLAFVGASVAVGVLAAAVVFAAGRREDAAGDAQARAEVTEHEVAGLLALTQEYARYGEPRAAAQWRLRHAAIAAALADDTHAGNNPAQVELRDVAQALPALFTRLEELPAGGDAFTARRKEALLDQLLTNTQAMGDYAYQWFQDALAQRRAAEREFRWIAFAAPCVMLLMLLASGAVVLRRVLLPMQRLDQAAVAVRRGDMSVRLDSDAQDEFGDLSREFDAMTTALIASDRQRDRSERQLRDITDNLPALVGYIDPAHEFRFANEKYREWLGHDPLSMVGRHVAEVLGQGAYAQMDGRLDRALAGERVQWARTVAATASSATCWSNTSPTRRPTARCGAAMRWRGRHRAPRRRTRDGAQRAAHGRSDQRDPGHGGLLRHGRDLPVRQRRRPALAGRQPRRHPRHGMRAALGETVYAQHEPYVREVLQGRRARLEGKVDFAGRAAHFQAHLIPDRTDGGAQRGFYLMTFDITALKEAEARRAKVEGRLRAITDNLPVAITYLDAEQRYRFVNRTGSTGWAARPTR